MSVVYTHTTNILTRLVNFTDARFIPVFIILLNVCCAYVKVTFTERNFEYGLEYSQHLVRLNVVSELLLVVNSSANFVVYVAFGRRFRRILRETFRFSFRFTGGGTAVTHDVQQGGGGGGPRVAAQRLQYHHNCVHVHKVHGAGAAGASQPNCRTAVIR